jgi:PHD/YefM family antitoxin component YafN of YafNO toxin-antitoxin module
MITYTKEEIIPSSAVSRNFGEILNKLSTQKLAKVAVIRNNKIEAVILPIETYEDISNNYLSIWNLLN